MDRGELLSPAQEAALTESLAALERRTSDQLVVVTVSSLGGQTVEAFGRALGNHWGVGQADKDNGVLILVAPTERKVRIEVGYGLEPILTNARAGEIISRDMIPYLQQERWHDAIGAGTRSVIATLIAHEGEARRGR